MTTLFFTRLKLWLRDCLHIQNLCILLISFFVYLLLAFVILQFDAILNFITLPIPLIQKIPIFFQFAIETFAAFSAGEQLLLILTAFFFAFNIELIVLKLRFVTKGKNTHWTFGAGVLSLAAVGCASCGFSVLSLLGIGGALTLLPLGGIFLSILALLILIVSFVYNLNEVYKECKVVMPR